MKYFSFLMLMLAGFRSIGQCNAFFTTTAVGQEATFLNLSSGATNRYYWNFGDGSSSHLTDPVHRYPGTGTYFVSLFVRDSANNCTTYYDRWITVVKPEPDSVYPFITDSIASPSWAGGEEVITVLNRGLNCDDCDFVYDAAGATNLPPGNWSTISGWRHARFVSRGKFNCFNPIGGNVGKVALKSTPYHYTSAKNYGDCSANFEFAVVSEDSVGQRILFSAMNKSATSYRWAITGFGNPIEGTSDTISHAYPIYPLYPHGPLYTVMLTTVGQGGCRDTLYQHILPRPTTTKSAYLPHTLECRAYPNPFVNQTTVRFPQKDGETQLTLYNMAGRIVRVISGITGGSVVIERGSLTRGVYYFAIRSGVMPTGFGKILVD